MKIYTQILQHLMAVVFTAILFGCNPTPSEEPTPTKEDTRIYISVPGGLWREDLSVNVCGTSYDTEYVDDSTGTVSVLTDSGPVFIACPSTAIFDSQAQAFTFSLPAFQKYDAPQETFIGSACSWASGEFPFRTAALCGIAGYVTIDLYTTGSAKPSWATLSPADASRPCAGTIRQDCINGTWTILNGENSVRLALASKELPTEKEKAERLTFALLPANYRDGFTITLEGGRQITIGGDITLGSRKTVHLGTFHIQPDSELVTLEVGKSAPMGTPSWKSGTRLSINGIVAEASGVTGNLLNVPFTHSYSYSAVYPVADDRQSDGKYVMHIATEQALAEKAPSSDPILCGFSTTGSGITLKQINGVLRLKIYTVPGPQRLLKSVRLTGNGVAATFTVDPLTGEIARTGFAPEGIAIDFGQDHKLESSNLNAPTAFSFVVLPGTYSGLKLEVTARDATCKIPEGLSEDDLWTTLSYDVPDATVRAGASTILTLQPKVEKYDWIRQNGVCYTGSKSLDKCTAAFIDTGWLVPDAKGHSICYECTMSGALPANVSDRRQERILFGAHGAGAERPVLFLFNENASARAWYTSMANLAARETFKQEISGQSYHVSADLDGIRSVRIGTDGIMGTSYLYMDIRRDDLGSDQWTSLQPQIPYFKFTSGSLKCNYPVYLFAKNASGNIGSPCPHIRIHRFIVTYDGIVQRDMTPVRVDGIPGMEDNAHPGTYYFNLNPYVETVVKNGCLTAFEVGFNSDL